MKNFIHALAGGAVLGLLLGISNISTASWNWWFIVLSMCAWYFTKPEDTE